MNTSVPVLPYCIIAGIQEEENTPPWYMLCSLKAETYALLVNTATITNLYVKSSEVR